MSTQQRSLQHHVVRQVIAHKNIFTAAVKENQHLLANYCTLLCVHHHVPLPIRQECRVV